MNDIAGCLHAFEVKEPESWVYPPVRRFYAKCECGWAGPSQRDRDSAIEDGMAHQEDESA